MFIIPVCWSILKFQTEKHKSMFASARVKSVLILVLLSFCFAACAGGEPRNSTPTATLKNFIAAAKQKDAARMKTNLSSGTLKIIEETARAQNKTLDQSLTENTNSSLASKVADAETRNEQIAGDTATLEIKNPQTGGWDKLYFSKENNEWKIALDKMMQEMLKDADDAN